MKIKEDMDISRGVGPQELLEYLQHNLGKCTPGEFIKLPLYKEEIQMLAQGLELKIIQIKSMT